jgi:hypothetical protein
MCGEEDDFKHILSRNAKNGEDRNAFSQSCCRIQVVS